MNHMGFPLDPKPDKAGEQKEPLLAKIKKVTFHDCGAEHDAYNASNDHPWVARQLQAITNNLNHDQIKACPSSRALPAIGLGTDKP